MSYRPHILIIFFSLLLPFGTYADHVSELNANHAEHQFVLPLTQESAAEFIRSKTGGKVLSVDRDAVPDETFFRVKVISEQGRVKIYRVDSSTGKIVE